MQIQKINRGPCCLYRRKVMLDPPVGPTSACWTLNSQIYVHSGLTWDHIIKKILFFQTMFFTGLLTVNAAAIMPIRTIKIRYLTEKNWKLEMEKPFSSSSVLSQSTSLWPLYQTRNHWKLLKYRLNLSNVLGRILWDGNLLFPLIADIPAS